MGGVTDFFGRVTDQFDPRSSEKIGGGVTDAEQLRRDQEKKAKNALLAVELDSNAQKERDAAAYEERRKRGQSGRASTMLTGGLGDTSAPTLASAVLLGS